MEITILTGYNKDQTFINIHLKPLKHIVTSLK